MCVCEKQHCSGSLASGLLTYFLHPVSGPSGTSSSSSPLSPLPPPPLLAVPPERDLAGPNCPCNEPGRTLTVGRAIVCVSVFTLRRQGALVSSSTTPLPPLLLKLILGASPSHLRRARSKHAGDPAAGRRWSGRLMDMFVYLFVLDMIN